MSDGGSPDTPITPERLAGLHAGLLDDENAARLRARVRSDPEAARMLAGLDRVRRDLAHLGVDAASAPEVPAAVTARVAGALRARRPAPTHSARQAAPRLRLFGAVAGVCAAVVAVGLGALMLVRTPAPPPTRSAGITAERITVSRTPHDIPLSDPQIMGLLTRRPDFGPLTDPQRRASCLSGLGYPAATKVLGARPLEVNGRPGVLMLLPAGTPEAVVALVVAPNCSSAGTELLADTVVTRP
jgi:hypothetical protein